MGFCGVGTCIRIHALRFRIENIDRTGSMITDTHVHNRFRTLCARARGCVHVFDFCHDWTKCDKGMQSCARPTTFIEPSVYQYKTLACINAGYSLASLKAALTDETVLFR